MGFLATLLRSLTPRRKKKKKKKRRGKAVRSGGAIQPAAEGAPKVLIAEVHGSGGKDISERVSGMISSVNGLSAFSYPKALKQNLRLPPQERRVLAADEGGTWLKEEKADLLIWGEMEDMGTVARLHILVRSEEEAGGTFDVPDTLALPVPLPEAAGDLVRSFVLTQALPISRAGRKGLLEKLKEAAKVSGESVTALPADTPGEVRASLQVLLGMAYGLIARMGDKKAILSAIAAFELAEKFVSADEDPVFWAQVQSHIAATLETDAKQKKDPEIMSQVAERYLKITETLARDTHADEWAIAHVRAAMTNYKLASMAPERMGQHLKKAASCFEEALSVYDRGRVPFKWAEAMNHYGVVQMALGGQVAGEQMLQQSIRTFRQALEVRQREINALLWAQTANNLGAACVALAKRSKDTLLLDEAATCFEGAMEVYQTHPKSKKKAAVIANNLARVKRMQGAKAA